MTEIENFKSALHRMIKDYIETCYDNIEWLKKQTEESEDAQRYLRGKISAYKDILKELE